MNEFTEVVVERSQKDAYIQAVRDIIDDADTLEAMHQRLVGLALDYMGDFKGSPMGVGHDLAVDDNRQKVILSVGHIVVYFNKPGTNLPGLPGLLADIGIESDKGQYSGCTKISIGFYRYNQYIDGITIGEMVHEYTPNIHHVRKLLQFF